MRLVRAVLADERRAAVYAALEEREFDYVVTAGAGRFEGESVVEVPVSDEAVGDVTDALSEAGVDVERFLVVEELYSAATPNADTVRARYADVYDRPSAEELRSLVDELNWDVHSFLALMAMSAAIAAVGLLLDSPVVVVGSGVIAPLVNPTLVTGIGVVLGERRMVRDSLRLQALGLVVAVASAFAVGLAASTLSLAPATLDLPALESVSVRFAPSGLAVLIGVVAGVAATVSLTAESSLINIVGVMVAAALIPAAGATGVALATGYPLVALGSALLVVTTVVAIDLAVLATLTLVGYRPSRDLLAVPSRRTALRVAAVALALVAVVAGTGAATAGQVAFERDANDAVDAVAADEAGLSTVAVRSEYADYSPFTGPETVHVEVHRTDGEAYPDLADRLAARIGEATGRSVSVQVEFVDRQTSG